MYLAEQRVHVFAEQNVHVLDRTKCTGTWLNKIYMYLTEQTVDIFGWIKCTCIWLNKMYMYLTVDKMYRHLTINKTYMKLTEQNVHVYDWTNVFVLKSFFTDKKLYNSAPIISWIINVLGSN
jgi:hypothetical protein